MSSSYYRPHISDTKDKCAYGLMIKSQRSNTTGEGIVLQIFISILHIYIHTIKNKHTNTELMHEL